MDYPSNNEDWLMRVAKGLVAGHSLVQKFGENPAVGTSLESVWDAGGLYPWDTFAVGGDNLSIVSTLAADSLTGTGARTIRVTGFDASGLELHEDMDMDGVTPVITTNKFTRVFRVVVTTAGTGKTTAGTITASIGATVVAQVINGNNQTLMALMGIPSNRTGFLLFGKASVGKGKTLNGRFYMRPVGGVFNVQHTFEVYQGSYEYPFRAVPMIPSGTDLDFRAKADAAIAVSAAFDVLLVDNDLLT